MLSSQRSRRDPGDQQAQYNRDTKQRHHFDQCLRQGLSTARLNDLQLLIDLHTVFSETIVILHDAAPKFDRLIIGLESRSVTRSTSSRTWRPWIEISQSLRREELAHFYYATDLPLSHQRFTVSISLQREAVRCR